MANDVFANGREISCKKADGKSICAFPDVCMTPPECPATPPGVPIPYPNTGMAKDTSSGSTSVKISGQEIMLRNKSYFKTSMGDEPGCAAKKGVLTSKIKGKVYFTTWSMDVKVEGANVVRHLDLTTHNHGSVPGNTPPWPYIDQMAMPDVSVDEVCEELKEKTETAEEMLPASKKKGGYTVATGKFIPAGKGAPGSHWQAASSVSSSDVVLGGKYGDFSPGIPQGDGDGSNIETCDGEEHFYDTSAFRAHEGHAEAKMLEDLFLCSGGRPKGVMVIDISWKSGGKTLKEPCHICQSMIDDINQKSSGEKCKDFQVVICP